MIVGGKRCDVNLPVVCAGSRDKLATTLDGTTWVTVVAFDRFTILSEILAVVPTLAASATVTYGVFDADYLTDGQERWNSGTVAENDATCICLDRIVVPGTLLRIKANAAATESVATVIYKMGT